MRKVVSLFSGAGGLDLGLEAAGFTCAASVEMDAWACRTLRVNGRRGVLEGDVHSLASERILETAGIAAGELDLLAGGPPCQPFSKSGYWARGETLRLDDPRAGTLEAYLRILRDLRPQAFLLENVAGIAYKGKDEGIQVLRATVARINAETDSAYSFTYRQLNAADYGVPQVRERVFVIGHREGKVFEFPSPTHADPHDASLLAAGREPWRNVWDAIGDLERAETDEDLRVPGTWGDLLPSIPEGSNYLYHTDRGEGRALFGWRRRYWSFLLKLAKDRPSWTIQAQPGPAIGPFHWRSRRLSLRELARIQTFPEAYAFEGNRQEAHRQIGNAVPSLMGEVLGRAIRAQFFGEVVDGPLELLAPRRLPIPPKEPLAAVPEKYLHLVGEHEAHPGTGKGYVASQRMTAGELDDNEVDSTA